MSNGRRSEDQLSETLQNVLDGGARLVAGLGALGTLVSLGFLGYLCARLAGSSPDLNLATASGSIDTLSKVLLAGVIALGVGSTYLFWGSEILGVVQLMFAAALFFAPMYVPSVVGSANGPGHDLQDKALSSFNSAGIWFGVLAIAVLIADVATRVSERARRGVKTDQLKYGKGVKEEKGRQNVFMGKCWQLPFCRQFVRERCPIYHAKTTCWKELVGCMCEEAVIRNAMENKPIPKDALLASKMIPRNSRLTEPQKKERCRNCVIYNEHQRHKYKAAMPAVTGTFLLVYVGLHGPLIAMMNGMVDAINRVIHQTAAISTGSHDVYHAPTFFVETMLAVFFLVGLSYAMKTLEFLIFRAKL